MEYIEGQRPGAAGAPEPEEKPVAEPRKAESKEKKPSPKELLDGPLALDQQCIMDLYEIKKEVRNASNNEIIMIALKLGLNQLSVAFGMKDRLQK